MGLVAGAKPVGAERFQNNGRLIGLVRTSMYRFLILPSVVESSALSMEYGAMAKSLPRYTLCSPLHPVFWVLCVQCVDALSRAIEADEGSG